MKRPALWTAAALALGIAVAQWLRPHPGLALGAVVAPFVYYAVTQRRLALVLLVSAGALCAVFFSWSQTAGRGDLAVWAGDKVTLTGTVITDPELRQQRGGTYVVRAEQADGLPAHGKVYVTQWGARVPGFGERVDVSGTLKPPLGPKIPGGFDQAAYLARQGVYLTLETGEAAIRGPGSINPLQRAAVAARLRLERSLKASLPERDAALMAGLLLGSRSDLPDDIKESFRASGVFHLLAVSGGNLAMIIAPLVFLLRRAGLSRRVAAGAAIPVVLFFVLLTGAGPSVTRAGLMAVLVLLGQVLRREKDAVNTLGAAVSILLLCSPVLLFDLGFQLSVSATLGILLFARPVESRLAPFLKRMTGAWLGEKIAQGLSVTIAAQVLVEPISLHNFGAFSTVAPVANLLVMAFLEPIVILGGAAAVVGLGSAILATWLNYPVRLGLWALLAVVRITGSVPGAYLEVGRLSTGWMLAWYGAVAVLAVPALRAWLPRVRAIPLKAAAACLGLVLATGFTWRLALAAPPDTLTVSFLDVGQGDALVIEAPGGRSMVVDTGAFSPADTRTGRPGFDAGAAVVVPYLQNRGIRRLDYLVLTHPDLDHAGGGAAILKALPVGRVLKSDHEPTEVMYLQALAEASRRNIPVTAPRAGDRIDLGGGVAVEVLGPPVPRFEGTRSDDNANCLVLRVVYRQIAMLFTCDMEAETEEHLLAGGAPLRADVLKVAHHGSGYSSTAPFLAAVRPKFAVVSAGNGNAYGHPHKGTIERLTEAGAAIYRTDRQGTITVRTDGFALTVAGSRGSPDDDRYRPLGLTGRRLIKAW